MTRTVLRAPPEQDVAVAGPTRLALLGSAVVFAVGTIMFGISMLRARVHPRVPALLYTVGLPAFAAAAPIPDTPLISALHVLVGVTIVWLAVTQLAPQISTESVPAMQRT